MKIQRKFLTIFFLAAPLLTGCSGPKYYGAARINSTPEGAEIINLKDDAHLGSTPAEVLFTSKEKNSQKVTIEFIKPGYKNKITSFNINHRHDNQEAAASAIIDVKVELEKE